MAVADHSRNSREIVFEFVFVDDTLHPSRFVEQT